MATQGDWHQRGHSKVKLTSMSFWKIKSLSSQKLCSEHKWHDLEELWKDYSERRAGRDPPTPPSQPPQTRVLIHSACWSASTWVTLQHMYWHTLIPLAQNSCRPAPVIECSVEWAAPDTHLQDRCTDKGADGQIVSPSLSISFFSSCLCPHTHTRTDKDTHSGCA